MRRTFAGQVNELEQIVGVIGGDNKPGHVLLGTGCHILFLHPVEGGKSDGPKPFILPGSVGHPLLPLETLQIAQHLIIGQQPVVKIKDILHIGIDAVGHQLKIELSGLNLVPMEKGLEDGEADSHGDKGNNQGNARRHGNDSAPDGFCKK